MERNFGTHKRDGIGNLVTDSFLTAVGPRGHREAINSAQSNKVLVYFVRLTIPLNGGFPRICRRWGANAIKFEENHDSGLIYFYETKRLRNVKEENRTEIYINKQKEQRQDGRLFQPFESPLIGARTQTEMGISTTVHGMPMGR
ncbi:hypothetical protein CDAR_392191 [Caerostris darwini]|uniref:Uncharacterized protein n=1 Tax=Caerostris darwini TaxID=1538125 RepID=A0AAV4UGK7_9ARAC|nr:hypothetical protein CDAR_392191 [Caerostris darwini]